MPGCVQQTFANLGISQLLIFIVHFMALMENKETMVVHKRFLGIVDSKILLKVTCSLQLA